MSIDWNALRKLPQDEQIFEMRKHILNGDLPFDLSGTDHPDWAEFEKFYEEHGERVIEMANSGELPELSEAEK